MDHALQYFHFQWNCGVQPSLTLKTLVDGSIEVSTTVRSSMPDRPFLQQRHCNRSGQSSRDRRRTSREQSRHQEAEVEVVKMQPVSNNKNAEMFPNTLEEQSVGVHQINENAEELSLDVSEFMDTDVKVIEAELEKCRAQNLELCNKIASCDREIEKKEHFIRKLELEVSDLKFKSFKPPRKLSFANVQRTDIPPSFHRQGSGRPVE